MNMPRYGKPNAAYVSTWFSDPIDKPMWALNLMKYRPIADYQDGRDLHISGADADMLYNPTGPLAEVGGRVMLATDVLHQISGDDITWDRVAVAYYPKRMAMMAASAGLRLFRPARSLTCSDSKPGRARNMIRPKVPRVVST